MRLLIVFFTFILCGGVLADEITVKMLNKGSDGQKMVFEPDIIKAKIGDTVKFVSVNKGHSVQSFKGAESRPAGAKAFKSRLNEAFIYKVEHRGIHMIICKPHYAMGMIGMIVGESPVNLETIKKLKVRGSKSKKRFANMLTRL